MREAKTNGWMTLAECAEKSGVSRETLRQWCLSGKLRSQPYGTGDKKYRLVRVEWLDELFAAMRSEDERRRAISATKVSGRPAPAGGKNHLGL